MPFISKYQGFDFILKALRVKTQAGKSTHLELCRSFTLHKSKKPRTCSRLLLDAFLSFWTVILDFLRKTYLMLE
ncbi:MAG: hypothetical protein QNL04_05800 [SAR324 cluster bacterium]|nr:hypothetical protein [SAR324 cluster bacterium]